MTIRRCFVALLICLSGAGALVVPSDTQTVLFPGVPVELVFRSLQPGEVILAALRDYPPVRHLTLRVGNRTYVLNNVVGNRPIAFIGLDVALKPSPLSLDIFEEKTDGTIDHLTELLLVGPKEFPKKNFRVNEAMLAPPVSEQERVKREQELVQAVYGIVTPEWLGTGRFIPPLEQEPFPNFGQNRIYNKTVSAIHAGVDIPAPYGTPIKASNSGRVVVASDLYLSGKSVIIDHGRGVFSLYFHCSKLLVKRGDMVHKGATIARVGNTGRSTGPHLHWGVRIFDSRVDPFSLVALPLD